MLQISQLINKHAYQVHMDKWQVTPPFDREEVAMETGAWGTLVPEGDSEHRSRPCSSLVRPAIVSCTPIFMTITGNDCQPIVMIPVLNLTRFI